MRIFLTLIVMLSLGFGGALIAERVEPTKSLIDEYLGPWLAQVSPTPPAQPDPAPLLLLPEGAKSHAVAELAAFGLSPCFPLLERAPASERPWLSGQIIPTGVFDRGALPPPPDLADHPGLIKIEGMRSRDGLEREHCAAARISEHWFITAAHCLIDTSRDRSRPVYDVIALTPSEDIRAPETRHVVVEGAVCHAAYDMRGTRFANDIALFYLADISAFGSVAIAQVETPEHGLIPFDFRRTYVAGWGKNGGGRFLQGGPVSIRVAGETMLAGERIGARGPNIGDSGAPLYLPTDDGPVIVGTLSQVSQDESENGARSIFIRIKPMMDWIRRGMEICEQDERFVCHRQVLLPLPTELDGQSVADSP
jgi:hypothetical protein